VVVAGYGSGPGALALAEARGWPVVADPRSGAWRPHPNVVPHLDAILRSEAARAALRPEVVVRFGDPLASRVVNEWLATAGDTVVFAPTWSDPEAAASTVHLVDDPDAAAGALAEVVDPATGADGWLPAWTGAAAAAAEVVAAGVDPATEPGIARGLVAGLPDGSDLVVSSSMPVRDVERYAAPRDGLRVLANRGANGIDGVVSTAVGVALGGRPTALLIGDLAFLHDSNGLLGAAGRGVDLVLVVVDNDGGGIFSFLPQAARLPGDRFEALFGTPHGLDLVALAAAYGVEARPAEGDVGAQAAGALAKGGVHVLVARTDRAANVEAHRRLDDAVAAAVTDALGGSRPSEPAPEPGSGLPVSGAGSAGATGGPAR
ncbi:MAG TPA: thiamine pyrophosphate-dependent enzyme, partial [Acidimicrobiales bacterium]